MVLAVMTAMLAGCGNEPQITDPVEESTQGKPTSPDTQTATEKNEPGDATDGQGVKESDFLTMSLGNGTCEISSCASEASVIVVPEELFGETVVGIGKNAFPNKKNVTKIVLPDSVEYIEGYAFSNCEKLQTIELGSGLKRAGMGIFNYCPALESVRFPDGMEEFNGMPIGSCEGLKEVYVPDSVTTIRNGIALISMCPDIVVVTPAGSAAEAAAKEAGIPVRNP